MATGTTPFVRERPRENRDGYSYVGPYHDHPMFGPSGDPVVRSIVVSEREAGAIAGYMSRRLQGVRGCYAIGAHLRPWTSGPMNCRTFVDVVWRYVVAEVGLAEREVHYGEIADGEADR